MRTPEIRPRSNARRHVTGEADFETLLAEARPAREAAPRPPTPAPPGPTVARASAASRTGRPSKGPRTTRTIRLVPAAEAHLDALTRRIGVDRNAVVAMALAKLASDLRAAESP